MNLREAARAAVLDLELQEADGFHLERPSVLHFKNVADFSTALKEQKAAIAIIPATSLESIRIGGEIEGTDYRLSHAAFSDLCHFTDVPVSFIKRLAVVSETTALDVMQDMIKAKFRKDDRNFILDTATNRIEGIVGAGTYNHLPNADALEYLLTATPELALSQGWLCGPSMRATVINRQRPLEPRKGDVVHYGCDLENAIHGDCSVKVSEYLERLVCTNGAVARSAGAHFSIPHRSEVVEQTQKAVVQLSRTADRMLPLMHHATQHLMLARDVTNVRTFLRNPRNGGSDAFDARMVKAAMNEAASENREPEATTLWNWHNAVTAEARVAPALPRRVQLEATGYRLLEQFSVVN